VQAPRGIARARNRLILVLRQGRVALFGSLVGRRRRVCSRAGRDVGQWAIANAGVAGREALMANKDKSRKPAKKQATKSLKEKRAEKRAKRSAS
jgi:hypothetical protein